tara:strand:+ start:991 stop:2418 length:1428 start_codon:yes stop_codon:yes gene_type:complete
MSLEKYLDQIVDQNIIKKILLPDKDSFPLGDFDDYNEIPLEWTKNLSIESFKNTYSKIDTFDQYVFIGMGGSISMARIASYLNSSKIFFLDNFDISRINKIQEVINKKHTAVFICSKSSNTLETKILDQILKIKTENKFYIKDGIENNQNILNTPSNTGGRFSISTHLGILPFYLAGFSLKKIVSNINKANLDCISNDKENPAIKIAAFLYSNFNQNNEEFSLSSINKNDYISDWIEQLISESTGKEESGILPIKNIDTFYPHITFTPKQDEFSRNFINIKIDYDESLFYKFQIFLYAIAIFCSLIKIQPFDQPNVESTKITTKSLIENKKINFINDLNGSKKNDLVNEIKNHNGIISLLVHSTCLNYESKENLIDLVNEISNEKKKVLIFFAPNYLHSMGQLLKGSFKNIKNIVINLHGNEDLNIPKSLYTLNTFVKYQGYSDHLELVKNERKSLYFETKYEELKKNLNRLKND